MVAIELENRLHAAGTVEESLAAAGDTASVRIRAIALLRLQHPNLTHEQLGGLLDPPMSLKTVKKRLRLLRRAGGVQGAVPEPGLPIRQRIKADHPELLTHLADDTTKESAVAIARQVAAYVEIHHVGPTWHQVATHVRPTLSDDYPRLAVRFYTDQLITRLIRLRWLSHQPHIQRSLRPGPRART